MTSRSSGGGWESRGRLGARVHALLVELRYIDLVIETYGENTPLGSDPTATMVLEIGWTYPYRHQIVRPIIAIGDQSRDRVAAELQALLDAATRWGEGVMDAFWTGITELEAPPVEALGQAAVSLAGTTSRILLGVEADRDHLLTDVGRWEGESADSFEAFVTEIGRAKTAQVWLADKIAVQLAATVAIANLARESVVNLLERMIAELDQQLAKRANQGAEYQRELTETLLVLGGATSGLVGGGAGVALSVVLSLIDMSLDASPASDTVDVVVTRAVEAADTLDDVRRQILRNADDQLDSIRTDHVDRIAPDLVASGTSLVSPRPDLADGAPAQEEFFHDTGTLQDY